MKNKMMRLLSLMLALVLAVGLFQGTAVEAEAAGTMNFLAAMDCYRDIAFPKKGQTVHVNNFGNPLKGTAQAPTFDRYDTQEGNWSLVPVGKYGDIASPTNYLTSVVGSVADKYHISRENVEVYQLKLNGENVVLGVVVAESSKEALFIGANWNSQGGGYLLVDRVLSDSEKDGFSFTITDDASDGSTSHTHTWKAETTGLGTKEAKTVITCTADGCDLAGETMTVELTASDVTLPGNVFTAEYTVSYMTAARAMLPLTVSQVPGFKYSPDGTNYTAIDMNTFEGKQGYYQASIVVMDGNTQVENLYVNYTVSDPAVTAATGDNRPIELMLAGMVTFVAMAAVAFVLDNKRRAGF